ncbi:hypothetical protein [Leptospira paudalimensis]|uniref:Uncharacterized protein n=1 Tax=Leptospira paudalimensis TaxID=2950024 RepID=A0ABT3M3C5_9LEPT|nr:hypothetical protein [Leptospira paudalimensis]MCW7502893.1 hypothetical protein [Leptospira paudalimensis]
MFKLDPNSCVHFAFHFICDPNRPKTLDSRKEDFAFYTAGNNSDGFIKDRILVKVKDVLGNGLLGYIDAY